MKDDLLLSNWLVVWAILYIIGAIPYNPSFAVIAAIIIITVMVIRLIYKNAPTYNVIKFIFISIVMKVGPLLILHYRKDVRVLLQDVYFGITLFIVYNIYLYMNDTNIIDVYKFMIDLYVYAKPHEHRTFLSKAYDDFAHLVNGEPNVA